MTVADLQPLLHDELAVVVDALQYQAQVSYGIIVGLGVVAGLLLIGLLLDRFDR